MRLITMFAPVHFFAQPVVTLIGLGIAIDYGLFMVSRFREELAEGYDTETAVRRTVMTAGRTVMFSAVLIVASLAGLLLFPQGFLKSVAYAGIASVMLAGDPVDHGAARDAGHPRPQRRRARRAHAAAGAVPAELEADRGSTWTGWPTSCRRPRPARGREGILGQARQRRDEAAGRVRRADRHRHDLADHSAGQVVPRRHQREVPAAQQFRAHGAGGVRQDLPRLPHRTDDARDPGRHAGADRARSASKANADYPVSPDRVDATHRHRRGHQGSERHRHPERSRGPQRRRRRRSTSCARSSRPRA